MRPIDADALEKVLDERRKDIARDADKGTADEMAETHGMLEAISGAISELLLLPVIPAESFNRAAWRMNRYEDVKCESGDHTLATARCSHCKRWCEQVRDWANRIEYEFCPHCGAKMNAKN